jgi:adenylosuccinate synthase
MKPNTLDVVVGGQFGSESKGRVTAELAVRRRAEGRIVTNVRVAGPNAGHVVIDQHGNRFALRSLPVGLVTDPFSTGVIAAGSEIDYPVLKSEVELLESKGHAVRDRLLIDPQATMLVESHRHAEGGNDGPMQTRMGSTGKGIGAARADRIWRRATLAGDSAFLGHLGELGVVMDTQTLLQRRLRAGHSQAVIVEGTQGYGLGLHAGHYPYCTSSDCRAVDFLAMAGISPWGAHAELKVHVVLRAYPIRVAGNSGPLKGETSWDELGLPEEHTTVTHKVRRVGQWDGELARAAIAANGGPHNPQVVVALAMADQRIAGLAGAKSWAGLPGDVLFELGVWIQSLEEEVGAKVETIGTGPDSTLWVSERFDDRQPVLFEGVTR